jgi:hypothetical protein
MNNSTHTLSIKPARKSYKWLRLGFAVAVLAIGLAWLKREAILWQIGSWWVVSETPVRADAIVVLGGDFDVRPFAAAELYKRGLAGTILVANVQKGRAERLGFVRSHTELNRDVLLKLDVPASAIITFGQNLSSTQEEASAIGQWALQSQAKLIIVPTELFATRRTRWIFNRELAPIGVRVIVDAYDSQDYTLDGWWRQRYGLVDFNNEILKYLYYRMRY